jgi:PAS domain-containing protein
MSLSSLGADLPQDRSAKLAAFTAMATDAMLINDGGGTIVMANQQVESLLGYQLPDLGVGCRSQL